MHIADLDDLRLHYRTDGNPKGAPVVFSNSLGTDLRLWDQVIPLLPQSLHYIRYDRRGHGLSDAPAAPYAMGQLIRDTERLLDYLGVTECLFVGLSIGGMIAQGLAVKRPDLIRAMVLSNTAARIATPQIWQERIDTVQTRGIEALADPVMERWFSPRFRATPALTAWRHMLTRTPVAGYAGCCAAIAGTDFYTTTATLRLPTLGIGGDHDGSTPPDLMRETLDLIPGARFELLRGTGHLPCVEAPEAYAALLTDFLRSTGHITP